MLQCQQTSSPSGRSLIQRVEAWGLQLLTLLLLGGVVQTLLAIGQTLLHALISGFAWIPAVRSLSVRGNAAVMLLMAIGLLFSSSPWLLDWLLQRNHRLQPLSLEELATRSSESAQLLSQRQHPPKLGILPATAPFAFTYGYGRWTEIVVSRGLLQQLSDEEIATVYAAELEQVQGGSGVLSGVVLVAYLPYWLYWTASAWGDRQSHQGRQAVAILMAAIGYGAYRSCIWVGCWLARWRQTQGDRAAIAYTGNPNGRSRALLKMAIGMAAAVQRQGYTPALLESFALLLPVSCRAALSLGSVYAHGPTPALFDWDRSHHPHRWLWLLNSHPLLGQRLHCLDLWAQRWQLTPELDWLHAVRGTMPVGRAVLQAAPAVGAGAGLAIGLGLVGVGWISYQAKGLILDWLWLERGSLCQGSIWLGLATGMLLRINPYFPDLPRALPVNPSLVSLLSRSNILPIDSLPVRLQGQLLGRRGCRNHLHQDLILQTSTGLIRLHYTSRAGWLGNLLSQAVRPAALIGSEPVTVTGWLRRGATVWIDVDTIQAANGTTLHSGWPLLTTVMAIASAVIGVVLILHGGW
jgi:Zn-dependent protease with chaperone function